MLESLYLDSITKTYRPVCIALGKLFPNQLELVLHDLRTQKILHIENAYSNRAVGDDSLVDIAEVESETDENDIIGPYSKVNSDGTELKSVTCIIRDEESRPTALMCINFKIEQLKLAMSVLDNLTKVTTSAKSEGKSLLANDWREQVNTIIRIELEQRGRTSCRG